MHRYPVCEHCTFETPNFRHRQTYSKQLVIGITKFILVCTLVRYLLPASYREASEIKEVREVRDPIKRVEDRALKGNLATEQELKVYVNCEVKFVASFHSCA